MADYRPQAPSVLEQDLRGKRAIVTGATKGIGRAIALQLASRGCAILGTYSSPTSSQNFDTLERTVETLYKDPGQDAAPFGVPDLHGVVADITSLPSVDTLLKDKPRIDILVLNAAINVRPKLGSTTEDDIQRMIIGNLHWPIKLVESMVRLNLFNPNSRVVVISSDRVRDPDPGTLLFNATKTALESLARSWALELPLKYPGTTVNAVSVGLTDTPNLRSFPPEAVEAMKQKRLPKVKIVQGGRIGYPEDVADIVGWLVSEKARWQTGSVVAANGGAEWIGGSS